MSILSISFVAFTIATVIVYYIIPLKWRWLVLLAASCFFYALSGWQGCIWVFIVAAVTYAAGLLQHRFRNKEKKLQELADSLYDESPENEVCLSAGEAGSADGCPAAECAAEQNSIAADPAGIHNMQQETQKSRSELLSDQKKIKNLRKVILAVAVVMPVAAMAVTKYYDVIRGWFTALPELSLIVPLGLSYFTFQCVGYVVDAYRGKFTPEKNFLKYLLFVTFFPQMTQGPISTFQQLSPQLYEGHRFNPDNFVSGAQLALWGFFKKMILADRLVAATSAISLRQPGWMILLTVIIYAIRLYADFSGGMDVIRGAAKMLGIDVIENFRRPFFSFSVAEYWRRWHISLGNWFRSYVFYPISTSGFGLWLSKTGRKLFGKKAGRALPATVCTIIIFFLIGIWHGASLNAVIYGLYFGLVMGIDLLLEPVVFKKMKKACHINTDNIFWKIFCMIRTWILIILPQYFAFTGTPENGYKLFLYTFKHWQFNDVAQQFTDINDALEWYIAAAAFLIMLIVDIICEKKPDLNMKIAKGNFLIRWIIIAFLILAVVIFGCYGTGYDASAFLYTHF